MTKVGWGAVLQGEPRDLDAWAAALKTPFEPWVERSDGETILRSSVLDKLDSADKVRDNALAYIDRLNGALALSQNSNPVRFGSVIKFAPNGVKHRTLFLEAASFALSGGFMTAHITLIGPDGKPVPPVPQPTEAQRWSGVADKDDLLDEALTYFGKGGNWFDIYKTIECLETRAGGERKFRALNWLPEAEVERLKRTANWARHAEHRFNPPEKPMPLNEARSLLGHLLRRALG